MQISGYVPQSFVDWKGKVSFVIFTPGCNMRCPFCHNSALLSKGAKTIPTKEVEEALRKVQWAIDGICITGGEPTLQGDLPVFCKKMKLKNLLIKLDTNGTNSEMLKSIAELRCLDYVAMDIKAPLTAESYARVAKCDAKLFEEVRKSVSFLMSGKIDYEFRTTWSPDLSEEDILRIGNELRGAKRWIIQQFRPVECLDPDYLSKPKTEYAKLLETAKKADGPIEVRIRTEEKGEERVK